MPIDLTEIRAAAATYVSDNVSCVIDNFTPDVPAALSPGEEFSFDLHVTNNGPLTLTNVRYQVWAEHRDIFRLIAPTRIIPTGSGAQSPAWRGIHEDTRRPLAPGEETQFMVIWPETSLYRGEHERAQLEPNETDRWRLRGRALALGNSQISARVWADIDLEALARSNDSRWTRFDINVV